MNMTGHPTSETRAVTLYRLSELKQSTNALADQVDPQGMPGVKKVCGLPSAISWVVIIDPLEIVRVQFDKALVIVLSR